MKRVLKFFIILFAVCALSSCGPPVGYIDTLSDYDTLWVTPIRLIYELGDPFNAQEDLTIISSDKGLIRTVSPLEQGVTIEISQNSTFGPLPAIPAWPPDPDWYRFPLPGIYFIEVHYNTKGARYTIEVRGYYVESGDGSDFMDIIWL